MPTQAKSAARLQEELKEEIAAAERELRKSADKIRKEYNEYRALSRKKKLTRREQEKKSRLKPSFIAETNFLTKKKKIKAARERENAASNVSNATSSAIKTVAATTVASAVAAAKRAFATNAGTRTALHGDQDRMRATPSDGGSLSRSSRSSMDTSPSRATPSNSSVGMSSRGSGSTFLSSITDSSAPGSNDKF